MPSVGCELPARVLADLAAQRAAVLPPARLTQSAQLAAIIASWLQERRSERHRALLTELRRHPLRPRAGVPRELQDQVLAGIQRGPLRDPLVAELWRAGGWAAQVAAIARRWQQQGLTLDELEAAGRLGWTRALEGWRPGGAFRTYAYTWVTKEIDRACRLGGPLVLESEHEVRIRRSVEKLRRQGLSPEEIAARAGLSPDQVERGLQGRRALGWADLDGRRM